MLRVTKPLFSSALLKKRGFARVSFTICGSPVCATQPAIPSPGRRRISRTFSPFSPRATSKKSSSVSGSINKREPTSDRIKRVADSMARLRTSRSSSVEFRSRPISSIVSRISSRAFWAAILFFKPISART
ncbi:MAG: hypothetical protein MPW16_05415 [Candidatus Manganitrophus sp.]|nr:MAG: hypothetical protein MPW16_05415 [Candidatus Manganitrophus sp.]